MWFLARYLAVSIVAFTVATAVAADPPIRLSDDGAVILYRAEAGEVPGAIAERFGIAASDLDAFLAANGIPDATRVASGHVYRIPNPLAARAAEAEARAGTLTASLDAARAEVGTLGSRLAALEARADASTRRADQLERLAALWPWVRIVGLALILAIAVASWLAYQSTTRLGTAEAYARGLADQLDERRRAALAERQASARRMLDLEAEVATLGHELASQQAAHPRPTGTH